jgi:16S rRNA C1402 (ribose-2'-O) methylase RsmI
MHEEGNYGTLDQIILYYKNNPEKVRGEFVLVIKGN